MREKVQQCELRDGAKLNDKTKSAEESYAKQMLGRKEGSRNENVLGFSWDCNKDSFIFELSALAKKADRLVVTKRSILKIAADMYDPLGIVSPVLVGVKVLFQELCSSKVEWDEELKNEGKNAGLAGLKTSKA